MPYHRPMATALLELLLIASLLTLAGWPAALWLSARVTRTSSRAGVRPTTAA